MSERDFGFKGKKITVMGLGLLGRQLAAAEWLAKAGAELIITDLKSEALLADSVAKLKEYPNIIWRLGEHQREDFLGRDMILKAAGVPRKSEYIEAAREDGASIEMEASLFLKLAPKTLRTVGVTGSKGKSTTTLLIAHFLEQNNVPHLVGGNVRGAALLPLLDTIKGDEVVVMELDSWQLQGFGEAGISPEIAVFTSFLPDHLDYYQSDLKAYYADKANIFLNQNADDIFITTKEVLTRGEEYGFMPNGRVVLVDQNSPKAKFVEAHSTLLGEHNLTNALLAGEALFALGYTNPAPYAVWLETFPGVEGRLQYLGETEKQVKIYNDNNATIPSACVAGIKALAPEAKQLIVIFGGNDKAVPVEEVLAAIEQNVTKVVLLPGTGSDKVEPLLEDMSKLVVVRVASVEAALAEALEGAGAGDIVLFSPMFTSFSLFNNEYERNDAFVAATQNYLQS